MTTRLSRKERINKYRAAIRFPTVRAMTDALGLKNCWYRCEESYGGYADGEWRNAAISRHGHVLVEYIQNRNKECIITRLYKVASQFFYDITPTKPVYNQELRYWEVGTNPIIKCLGSKTNRYQILDLLTDCTFHHAFEFNEDSTAGECFRLYERTMEGIKKFERAATTMMLWLDMPTDINGRDWHKARRKLKKGTIEGVFAQFTNMLSGKVDPNEVF